MNIYDLSRNLFDYSFANPEKIKPNHIAIYFFAIEHCNRLGWKDKFGLPTTMVMEAIGIKSYTTYISALNDLVDIGFIKMIEKSKNQYSSNIIALPIFDKALGKALDKALIKHTSKHLIKQCESTHQSIVSIDKQIYKSTNTPIYKFTIDDRKLKFSDSLKPFLEIYGKEMLTQFYNYWTEPNKSNTKFRQEMEKTWDLTRRLNTWASNDKSFKNTKKDSKFQHNSSVANNVSEYFKNKKNENAI